MLIQLTSNHISGVKMSNVHVRNLAGRRFGRLLVLEEDPVRSRSGHVRWACRCDCGKITVVDGTNLTTNHTSSCGCLIEKHGLSYIRLYHVWANMKQRCNNPNHSNYSHYGGRGIKVCPEWENNVKAFYDFAMANGCTPYLTIDRIDNDRGYYPENVRFVSQKVQQNNRSNNSRVKENADTSNI